MKRLCLIVLLLVASPVAWTGAPPASTARADSSERPIRTAGSHVAPGVDADPAWLNKIVHGLAARGDADSLLTAALLTYSPSQRAQYAQAAALVASKDAGLAWLHWQFCDQAAHCDTAAALAWWQALEPGNAAAWLPNAAAAERANDAHALDAALRRMAHATYFDTDAFHLAQRALQVRENAPLPPKLPPQHRDDYLVDFFERSIRTMQQQGPFMRDMEALGHACRIAAMPATRAQACARIGTSMARSGALIAMMAGNSMVMHNSNDATTRSAANRRLYTLVWRVTHWPELARDSYDDRTLARVWLDALRTRRHEDATLTALLHYRHIPDQPPPGWQPPRSR
ncbi:MAG TPA: hypothetical protein VFW60_02790 [Rhodanobacteraceae bacterium]|nr:hypothetical protein [Rhodanobacteraceae bacterium]